jgi:Ni/Fe-hydrogenase subunit HybB-like protein
MFIEISYTRCTLIINFTPDQVKFPRTVFYTETQIIFKWLYFINTSRFWLNNNLDQVLCFIICFISCPIRLCMYIYQHVCATRHVHHFFFVFSWKYHSSLHIYLYTRLSSCLPRNSSSGHISFVYLHALLICAESNGIIRMKCESNLYFCKLLYPFYFVTSYFANTPEK